MWMGQIAGLVLLVAGSGLAALWRQRRQYHPASSITQTFAPKPTTATNAERYPKLATQLAAAGWEFTA